MRAIELYSRVYPELVALVDDEDFELINQYRWNPFPSKDQQDSFYARGTLRNHSVLMHKLITGWSRTDHKDHNGLNNRRYNLRPATARQNSIYRRKRVRPASSIYKGVVWRTHNPRRTPLSNAGRWVARITVDGKQIALGRFTDEREAAVTYNTAAVKYFGEFAHINQLIGRTTGKA